MRSRGPAGHTPGPGAGDSLSAMLHVTVSVVEPSGDRLAAELITALRARTPVSVRGIAGPALRGVGVEPVAAMEEVAVMGLAEVLRKLGRIRSVREALLAELDLGGDVFIGVDAPDFQGPLAARARERGMRAVGYVSPQVWAWRRSRIPRIAETWDQLLCLFAFEPELYAEEAARTGLDVRWTGHPVVDRVPFRAQVDPGRYALLPGSREQELARHLPVFLEVAERVRASTGDARFALVVPEAVGGSLGPLPPWIERAGSVHELADCRAALTKSGTVTLELACMGVPMVVAHRVHPLTWLVGRLLVRQVSHLAMPNVLAGAEVVPEHLQHLDAEALAQALLGLPLDQELELSALGGPGAADRAAQALLEGLA